MNKILELGAYVREYAPGIGTLECVECASERTVLDDRWCPMETLILEPTPAFCDYCRRPVAECKPREFGA